MLERLFVSTIGVKYAPVAYIGAWLRRIVPGFGEKLLREAEKHHTFGSSNHALSQVTVKQCKTFSKRWYHRSK